MADFTLTYKAFGESALLIEWPARIDDAILQDILLFQTQIEQQLCDLLRESQPAYNSLTLFFDPEKLTHQELTDRLRKLYENLEKGSSKTGRHWQLPVCYHPSFGLDLEELAEQKGISTEALVRLHTAPFYTVYFIGFLPGFLYLGGLAETLHTPRRDNPRLRLPSGSVGIAGSQTGIYPQESPGGWHIIGNCPIPLFDPTADPPCFIQPGDRLSFNPVSEAEYYAIQQQLNSGTFKLKERLYAGS